MRRLIIILAILTSSALAQNGNTLMIRFAGAPSGTCAPIAIAVNDATGDFYDCKAGAWNQIGGSGTPSGPAGGDLTGTYPNPTIKADVGLTGTPTAPTAAASTNTTQIATTAYVQSQFPLTNVNGGNVLASGQDWVFPQIGTMANFSQPYSGSANKATLWGFWNPLSKTATKIAYKTGTTADNTTDTYDIGFYSGLPGGTCTLLGHIGPTAGTTFAPTTSTIIQLNLTGSMTLPAGLVWFAASSSATTAQATYFGAPINASAQSNAVSVTTGGTLPGSVTCPSLNNTGGFPVGTNIPSIALQN